MPVEKNNLDFLNQRLDTLENTKANKEFVAFEFSHLKDSILHVKDRVDEGHKCSNAALFESIQSQVRDNSQSIKKIYTWQATVGISLLVFFLTMGVAALRFVDKIDYAVQSDTKRIDKIEKTLEDKNDMHQEIRDYILKLSKNNN